MIDHFQFSSLIEYCVAKSSLELRSKKLFRVGNLSKLLFSDLIFNLDEKGCLTRRQGGREGFFLLFFIEIWFITCSSSSQWFSGVDLWKSGLKPKGDKKKFFKGEKEKWSCFQVQNMPFFKHPLQWRVASRLWQSRHHHLCPTVLKSDHHRWLPHSQWHRPHVHLTRNGSYE